MLRRLLLRLYRLPERSVSLRPADLDLDAEDVEMTADDGSRLRGWYLPAGTQPTDEGPAGPTGDGGPGLVVMHGWGSAAEDLLPMAHAVAGSELSVLFLDARGHGRSDAVEFMSMPRFAEDVETAVAWLRARPEIDGARVGLVGHSVGAGACLMVAAHDPRIAAVVSISSMAHPQETIARSFHRYRVPRALILAIVRTIERTIGRRLDDFAPVHTITRTEAPVLIVHGTEDETVPETDAVRLAEAGGANATLLLVPGADHRNLDGFTPVMDEVIEHLVHAMGSPAGEPAGGPAGSGTGSGVGASG